jgi:hypothetical protein
MNGISFRMEPIASATSFVSRPPDFGASHSQILPSAKLLCHSFPVTKTSASTSYINSGLETITRTGKPLSVRNQMTGRCSMDIPNVRTTLDFLENGDKVNVDRRTRTFKGQIGEVEIVPRKISLILISAHYQVRSSRGYKLIGPSEIKR